MTTFAPRPAVADRADYTFPSAGQWQLDNGVRVVHLPLPGKLLTLVLTSRGGVDVEHRGEEGLATLATRLRREGTRTLSAQQFGAALDRIGAHYHAVASSAATTVATTVPASNLAAAVSLLAETAAAPAFDAAETDRQRGLQLDQLRQWFAEPSSRAELGIAEVCFAEDDRRARPHAGTLDSIPTLTEQAVRRFAASHLTPGASTLIVAGECSRDDLDRSLADSIAAWQPGPGESAGPARHTPTAGPPRVLLVHRPGAVQTEIRVAAVTPGRDDERWAGLTVAAHVLGGSINSRLSTVLREQKGYTYGVHAYLAAAGQSAGQFVIATAVDTASTAPALADLRAVLDEAATGGFTDTECAEAIREKLGRDGMRLQTAGAVADVLRECVDHDLPLDWLNAHRRAIAGVSASGASAGLAEIGLLARPHVAIVGDAEQIEPAVTRTFPDAAVSVG